MSTAASVAAAGRDWLTACSSLRPPTVSVSPCTSWSSPSCGSILYSQSSTAWRASLNCPECSNASSNAFCLHKCSTCLTTDAHIHSPALAMNCSDVLQNILPLHLHTTDKQLHDQCSSVTKQYNLVPAERRWCCVAGKAKSNGSLPPGEWLIVSHMQAECLYTGISLSAVSKRAPSSLGVAYCLAKPGLALIQCQPWPALLQRLATWLTLLQRLARGLSHISLLQLSCQRGWHLDAANQSINNGHSL